MTRKQAEARVVVPNNRRVNSERFVWLAFYRMFTDKQWAKLLHLSIPEFVAAIDEAKRKSDIKLGIAALARKEKK